MFRFLCVDELADSFTDCVSLGRRQTFLLFEGHRYQREQISKSGVDYPISTLTPQLQTCPHETEYLPRKRLN